MGDMGDDFKAMNAETKLHHAKMLAKANTEGWTKHTDYHFSRTFDVGRIEWWPSSGKAKYNDKMIYGHAKVNKLIKQINDESKKDK